MVKRMLRETALERIQAEKMKVSSYCKHCACTLTCSTGRRGNHRRQLLDLLRAIQRRCSGYWPLRTYFLSWLVQAALSIPLVHVYLGCIETHIHKPRTEDDARFKDDERDCPMCRQTISSNKLFDRTAFEPTDAELDVSNVNVDPLDISWEVDSTTGEGRYTAKVIKKKPRRSYVEDDYSDLDDFIVDDDEEDDDAAHKSRKTSHRRKSRPQSRVITSEDESDGDLEALRRSVVKKQSPASKNLAPIISLDSDSEGSVGANLDPSPSKTKAVDPLVKPAMMSSFLPSTKMQRMMKYLQDVAETHPDDKVCKPCNFRNSSS